MHFFVDFVRNRLTSGWRPGNTGWVSGNCPVCTLNGEARPDTRRRGGFHFEQTEWVYHCFNCGFTTGWKQGSHIGANVKILLKEMGVEPAEIQRASLELMREQETTSLLNPEPVREPDFRPDWPEIELPDGTMHVADVENITTGIQRALETISNRGLTHWPDWYVNEQDWKYRNRLILPYRHNGQIVGWSARSTKDRTPARAKYVVNKPPHYVFNLDRQKPDRNAVVVVEGDLDAITIDAVGLGSNSLSKEQASLINQLNRKTVLLPDADHAGNALIGPAIEQGWFVSFPEWMDQYKDANLAAQHLGRTFVLYSTLKNATDNPTKIRVLAKRYLR